MVEATENKQNPEVTKTKQDEESLIKGMRQLEFKNVIQNLESKKATWESLKVP